MSSFRSSRGVSAGVLAASLLLGLAGARSISAQSTTSGFAPGARAIVNLDFAGTAIGEIPNLIRVLQGSLEVVDKDGMHMLRASSPSEFVIQLPEVLPPKFTVEFEIIPKECCNPEDLMLEGAISGSRSSVSAQLTWHPSHIMVVGGNSQMFQMDMPAVIGAVLPSTLTQVAVSFDDETVKMYTNGRRLYTLADRKFVRGRVMRVSLGGQDDDKYAVYLARVRIADAATTLATTQSASTSSSLSNVLNSGAGTLATSDGGAVPVSTNAPSATSVTSPTNPGTTAGPLTAGTVAPTPAQTAATQPTALSSPTNPLPVVSAPTTAQQQNAAQAQQTGFVSANAPAPLAAATGPVSSLTGPTNTTAKLAGPVSIRTLEWSANSSSGAGWGVAIIWSPVSGATSYRVSRTVTGTGIAGTAVTVISMPAGWFGSSSNIYALDPTVEPFTDYTYWVEGVLVSGVLTNPSPVSSIHTATAPSVANLRATVGGTTQVVLPGSFGAGGPVPGSNVTWAWDALPLAYVYEISYAVIGKAGLERKTLPTSVTLPPRIAPITFGVPQGSSVEFCVSVWGSTDPRKSLPSSATCLTTQVP